jgi:hypothetical protein
MTQRNVSILPLFMVWPAHNGPAYEIPWIIGTPRFNVHAICPALNGNVSKSLIAVSNNTLGTKIGGRAGFSENPRGIKAGSMFSWAPAYMPSGTGTQSYTGVDIEGANLGLLPFPLSVSDQIGVVTYTPLPSPGSICMYYNGSVLGAAPISGRGGSPCSFPDSTFASTPVPIVTQDWMGWGTDGDQAFNGSVVIFEEVFTSNTLTPTAAAAAYTNANAFYSALTPAPAEPGDLMIAVGADIQQLQYMVTGYGLRQLSVSYTGPLATVCQGITSTCENIGNVNGDFDVASANAFCGPRNCTAQTLFNQSIYALATSGNIHLSTQNVTAASASQRPSVTFNCVDSRPCLTFSGTQFLCSSTAPRLSAPPPSFVSLVVAQRTGNVTAQQAAYGGTIDLVLGFAAGANQAYGESNSNATLAAADNAWHGEALQVVNGTGVILTVDGTAAASSVTSIGDSGNSCLGAASSGGGSSLTGKMVDAYMFSNRQITNFTMTSGQIATLQANEQAYWGY